jgi:hypothetical protein
MCGAVCVKFAISFFGSGDKAITSSDALRIAVIQAIAHAAGNFISELVD